MSPLKMLVIASLCIVSVANAHVPIQYVNICGKTTGGFSITGLLLPGTDTCHDPQTGKEQIRAPGGIFVTTQSILLQRINALETELAAIEAQMGLTQP
jgi:hypothetical protein